MTEERAAHREESLYDPGRKKCVYGRNIITYELFASITDRGVIICRVQKSNALDNIDQNIKHILAPMIEMLPLSAKCFTILIFLFSV